MHARAHMPLPRGDEEHRAAFASPRTVVVFRAVPGMGDLLLAVPALRSLRDGLPAARISFVGLASAAEFVARFSCYLDEFVEFPGYPGLFDSVPRIHEIPGFLSAMQTRRFDLAVQLHGSGVRSNTIVALFGAARSAGCYIPGQYNPDPELGCEHLPREHEVRRLLAVTRRLGMPETGEQLEFPLAENDLDELRALPEGEALLDGRTALVHPSSHAVSGRWPSHLFAVVGDALAARGLRVALSGTAEEASVTAAVLRAMKSPATDLTGRTSLGSLAGLIAAARIVVCNDSGISHLATAVDAPSVTVFTASDPDRWASLDTLRHRSVGRPFREQEGAQPGWNPEEHCLRDGCLKAPGTVSLQRPPVMVSPAEVLGQVDDLLADPGGR